MTQMEIDYDSHEELDARIDQEEAHFYWTVQEFQDCIHKYGCAFVLSKLDADIKLQIKEKLNV
jgi:hypothetical protein